MTDRYYENTKPRTYDERRFFSGSRFSATYDGPIITDRTRRELLDAIDKRHEWRVPRNS